MMISASCLWQNKEPHKRLSAGIGLYCSSDGSWWTAFVYSCYDCSVEGLGQRNVEPVRDQKQKRVFPAMSLGALGRRLN